jgi:RNA polymerase sigma-70 factor (ECF subfamily)
LKSSVWGEKSGLSYAEIAGQAGLTEGAVKVAVHRLRQRFGELLRSEIHRTVTKPEELDEELRYLIAVMRAGQSISGNPASPSL